MRRRAIVCLHVLALCAALGCGGDDDDQGGPGGPDGGPPTGGDGGASADAGPPGGGEEPTLDTLRLVDPCSLLDEAALMRFGTPDENVPRLFGECSNFMEYANGERHLVILETGRQLFRSDIEMSTEEIGGFPIVVEAFEASCEVSLAVIQGRDLGVTVTTSRDADDPCPMARDLAAAAAERLRAGAMLRTPPPGSLMSLDPCTAPGALPAGLFPGATDVAPFGLDTCDWNGPGSLGLTLRFLYTGDPATEPEGVRGEPVDLGGGVTGYRRAFDLGIPICELDWLHLAGSGDEGEVIRVSVGDSGETGMDVCAAATDFAGLLVPVLLRA
jgi:hypothetical protein